MESCDIHVNLLVQLDARVVFETCVNRLTQKPETKHKAKPLYSYMHKYESQYGELSQIARLEERIAGLFPDDPKLNQFASRYSSDKFDPVHTRLFVSPAIQLRPKVILPSIEQPTSARDSPLPPPRKEASPRPQYLRATNSPKRPLAGDDHEEISRPRKLARGESPLKGAAGRRLDQQRRTQGAPLSRDITFFLSILPPAHSYNAYRFDPASMVSLVRDTPVPDYNVWKAKQEMAVRYSDNGTQSRGGHQAPSHMRQASGEHPAYQSYPPGRVSPSLAPTGRPISPYDAGAGRRLVSGSGTYRSSPLRPGSSGSYEPPPAVYRQELPPGQYPQPGGFGDVSGVAPGWPLVQSAYPPAPPQYGRYQY
jgi:cleavage stimulation factor subunit 3